MKIRHWLAKLTFLAGLLGVSVWFGSIAERTLVQAWQNWVFDQQLRGQPADFNQFLAEGKERLNRFLAQGKEGLKQFLREGFLADGKERLAFVLRPGHPHTVSPPHRNSEAQPSGPRVAAQQSPAKRADRDRNLIGRLTIPRLHVSAVVREGVGEKTLRVALGHIPGTALPGMSGNVAVAGHRDTLFRPLRQIRPNDLIRLESLDGTYVYRVEETEIVGPRNVSVLRLGSEPELTLVTCYPFYYVGAAPKRFVVRARQISANARTPAL
jgi:sortase A